jgi:hypothetical protein
MKRLVIILFMLVLTGAMASARDDGRHPADQSRLAKTTGSPVYTYMNINNISTVYRNDGTSDIDVAQQNSGLVFPKGSRKTAMYSSGLLWAARIAGDPQVRVGGSGHRSGLQPGRVLPNGSPEDPNLPHVRIYRVRPDYKTADLSAEIADERKSAAEIRTQYETDWNEWPAQYGAPYKDVDSNGTFDPRVDVPGFPGADQTIWYVANDLNSTNTSNLYGTQPLGIECQVTSWAYAQEGPLGNMVFRSFLLINKSSQRLDSMVVAMWSDPDLGFAEDDYVGCDTSLSLGFVYNSSTVDQTYGSLPPPAAGFDFFQGPIVAEPGATATFRGKNIQGYKNLPMTSFFYFIRADQTLADPVQADPAGATQMYNFMRGKVGLTGQYFLDPQGNPTTYVLTGDPVAGTGWLDGQQYPAGDRRMGLASGPFSMAPGDTQEVVIAEICAGAIPGVDRLTAINLLKFYDKSAQLAYDNFFSLPAPPSAPKVTATELDEEILLNWGSDQAAVTATEGTDNRGFKFQGYNVYQLPSAGATITEGKKIAVYDLAGDGITRVTDQVFDPSVGVVTGKVVQLGTDSGIKRFVSVNADALKGGTPLVNGLRYYFAVTSYAYNADPNAVPNNLENPLQIITAVPHANDPGVRYSGAAGDTVQPVSHAGSSDGSVVPIVVDPGRTTGQNYKVKFEDNAGTVTWKLVNVSRGDTVLRGQTNQSGDDDYLVVDGLQVKVLGPPPGMKGYATASNNQRDITFAGADPNGSFADLEGYTHTIGNAFEHWFSGSTVTLDRLRNVEIRFADADGTWDPKAAQTGNFSKAYRYVRSAANAAAKPEFAAWIVNAGAGYAYQDYNYSVPFAAYDMESNPPRRLAVGHLENNQPNGTVDGRYWPPAHTDADVDNAAGGRTREWFFIFDAPYSETPDAALQVDILNETTPMMWWGIVTRRAVDPNAAGNFRSSTVFTIQSNHVNSVNDEFSFTAPAVTFDAAAAKADVGQINVFPNPYYGVNTEEINKYNRFVTFSHLPREARIRIYNLAGVEVRDIQKNSASQFERWDLANESGLPVGSGLYIVHIDMPGIGSTKILKLAVVQEQQILDRF